MCTEFIPQQRELQKKEAPLPQCLSENVMDHCQNTSCAAWGILQLSMMGLGKIIEYDEKRGLVTCKFGVIQINKNYTPTTHTGNLGIGEIKMKNGLILGELGIASVNPTTGKLMMNTGDLGIGKIIFCKENVGMVIGPKGLAKINLLDGKVIFKVLTKFNLIEKLGKIIKTILCDDGSTIIIGNKCYVTVSDNGEISASEKFEAIYDKLPKEIKEKVLA